MGNFWSLLGFSTEKSSIRESTFLLPTGYDNLTQSPGVKNTYDGGSTRSKLNKQKTKSLRKKRGK